MGNLKFKKRECINRINGYNKKIEKLKKEIKRLDNAVVLMEGTKKIEETLLLNHMTTVKKEKTKFNFELKMQHIKIDYEIMCVLYCKEYDVKAVGVAKCKEGETFDVIIGLNIAENRAMADFYAKLNEQIIENL